MLAIPLLCLLYVVSRPGVPHTGELESDDIPRFTRCLEGLSETQYAVATLLSSELYVPGAFALGRSIQEHLPGDYQLIDCHGLGRSRNVRGCHGHGTAGWLEDL